MEGDKVTETHPYLPHLFLPRQAWLRLWEGPLTEEERIIYRKFVPEGVEYFDRAKNIFNAELRIVSRQNVMGISYKQSCGLLDV